jgi:hypothetical protein
MAGEKRGKVLEFITAIALRKCADKLYGNKVIIELSPRETGLAISPDILISTLLKEEKRIPKGAIQITWTPQQEDLRPVKFWRDFAEMNDCKRLYDILCLWVIAKREDSRCSKLLAVAESVWDGTICLEDLGHGETLIRTIDNIVKYLESNNKSASEQNVLLYLQKKSLDSNFKKGINELKDKLSSLLSSPKPGLDSYWDVLLNWQKSKFPLTARVPNAVDTYLRWGLSELVVFPEEIRKSLYNSYYNKKKIIIGTRVAEIGGILKRSIGGYNIESEALKWFLNFAGSAESAEDWIRKDKSERSGYLASLRDAEDSENQINWIKANYNSLITSDGMENHLKMCFDGLLRWNDSIDYESLWLFSSVKSLLKAADGGKSFGWLANLASITNTLRSVITGQILPKYETRQQLPNNVFINAIAISLAGALKKIPLNKIDIIKIKAVHKGVNLILRNKILCHGVDPIYYSLKELIPASVDVRVPSAIVHFIKNTSKASGFNSNDLSTEGLIINSTFMKWQSAYGSHATDKTKELCGRLAHIALSHKNNLFNVNNNIKKSILIIDGTFSEEEILFLLKSGWDRILYPDELNNIPKLVLE